MTLYNKSMYQIGSSHGSQNSAERLIPTRDLMPPQLTKTGGLVF